MIRRPHFLQQNRFRRGGVNLNERFAVAHERFRINVKGGVALDGDAGQANEQIDRGGADREGVLLGGHDFDVVAAKEIAHDKVGVTARAGAAGREQEAFRQEIDRGEAKGAAAAGCRHGCCGRRACRSFWQMFAVAGRRQSCTTSSRKFTHGGAGSRLVTVRRRKAAVDVVIAFRFARAADDSFSTTTSNRSPFAAMPALATFFLVGAAAPRGVVKDGSRIERIGEELNEVGAIGDGREDASIDGNDFALQVADGLIQSFLLQGLRVVMKMMFGGSSSRANIIRVIPNSQFNILQFLSVRTAHFEQMPNGPKLGRLERVAQFGIERGRQQALNVALALAVLPVLLQVDEVFENDGRQALIRARFGTAQKRERRKRGRVHVIGHDAANDARQIFRQGGDGQQFLGQYRQEAREHGTDVLDGADGGDKGADEGAGAGAQRLGGFQGDNAVGVLRQDAVEAAEVQFEARDEFGLQNLGAASDSI